MVDEDRQRADLIRDPANHLTEVLGLLIRQPSGGFVEQHDARPSDDGAGHLDEAAVTRAEHADLRVRIHAQPDERDRTQHVVAA